MSCLTQEQLAALVLNPDVSPEFAAHAATCPECGARLDSLRGVVQDLDRTHAALNAGHDAGRERLLGRIADLEPEPAPTAFRRATQWIGELTMRQRMALLAASLAPVLGLMLIWMTMSATPALGMDQMAQRIREATSYRLTLVQEMEWTPKPGDDPVKSRLAGDMYWRAPGDFRMELSSAEKFAGELSTKIYFTDKPGIELVAKEKFYRRVPAYQGHMSPLMVLQKLGTLRGDADRQLGTREIGDVEAVGFEIDAQRIDPDAYAGPVQVWLDPQSQLPLQVEVKLETGGVAGTLRFENIRWNADLDPQLFDTTPPAGYADRTPEAPPVETLVEEITAGLKTYAEIMDGHYPRVKIVYGDVTRDELLGQIGVTGVPTREQLADPKYREVQDAVAGFAALNTIQRENADAAWYGQTVGPEDEDKVLFRWKRDDGSFQVIYGDLRSEQVSAEKLKRLEGSNE